MFHNEKKIHGYQINATDDELGKVESFLFDDESWTIRYLVADTRKWLPGRTVLISPISITAVNHEESHVTVQLSKEQVKDSPNIDSESPVSREQELKLNQYYGWGSYWGGPGVWGANMYPNHLLGEHLVQDSLNTEEEPGESHIRSTSEIENYEIHAEDGGVGHVESFLLDDESWRIRYIIVETKNWQSGKKVLVAPAWITEVKWEEKRVYVSLNQEKVKNAPEYDPDSPISNAFEEKLHNAYGKEFSHNK
ncbi:PRC-barrel domain-containing protein [Halobacillus ihumii]|uniref:PRC-barrel domain-containing protein n=1 Tax=Halobacillus ihumii TaxID=2686092 RepID=UPI0013D87925|nr:PRC-barrel domain-containing protein [Halobacillus ihumii]